MLIPFCALVDAESIAGRAAAIAAAHDLPGLALALVEDGAIAHEQAFGFADLATGARLAPGHVFQAASLAKMVTAWTVLQLENQGQISLDAPVMRYVSRWRLPGDGFDIDAVTVRRILGHRAGLSLPDYPGFEPDQPLPSLEASLAGETNGAGDLRVIETPGARFRYSGGGYTLLALAVEEITGVRFADHVTRAVLGPLGMSTSTFDRSTAVERATGHDAARRPLPFYRYDGAAAAGLLATIGDLARFAAAHVTGPRGEPAGRGVVSPVALLAMTSMQSHTGRADGLWAGYGLGYEIEPLADGCTLVGHHGVNRGWRALLAADLEARRAIVLFANGDAAMPALEQLLHMWRER